ncbi:MAG: RNA polymerase subunit sigma-24, partial [Mycobacterium sp.]
GLMALLAPGATWTADHGGKATAIRRPVVGARRVAAIMARLFQVAGEIPQIRFETAVYNSAPAMRNPTKLTGVTTPREIGR